MHTMKTRLIALSLLTAISCVLRGGATTPAEDRLWATRITCELQTAGPASLPALHWQQGTSPLLSFDQYRSGRAVDADTNVTAVLRLAPTATNLIGWVSVTNYATVGNGYLIQMPSVGTNTAASGAWWYTAYFIRGTAVYWTGSGRVTITATTSTGADGLVWQEILPPGSSLTWDEITGKPSTFPPETHSHDYTTITNPPWLTSFTETDEIALQAVFTHTNNEAIHLSTEQVDKIANAVTNELDLAALRAYHYGSPDIVESPAEWFVFDGAGTITLFNWEAGRTNVVIPWAIGGVPVTAIGANAFHNLYTHQGHPVVSVVAPQTVTAIGDYAFRSCGSLTSVSLPQVTAIGDYAFRSCGSLTSVSLPQATAIGNSAFFYCNLLTSVSLPQAQTVGAYAFANCTSLTSASLPQAQTVGAYAFNGCDALTSVSLPQAQTVGDGVFSDCDTLASVNLPQATAIGDVAFYDCASLASVSLPQATTIGNSAFNSCGSLASVSLPQAQTVGAYAFYNCTSLTAVHMGQNAPAEATGVFADITQPPTVYVTDPQATGWGAEWNGAPVVRPNLYAEAIYQAGELVATTGHVAQAIAGKVDAVSGLASNLWLHGETIVSDSYTNLWWRNVYSNGWHWLVAYTNAPGGGE